MLKETLQYITTNFFKERDTQKFTDNNFIKSATADVENIKLSDNIITKVGFGQGTWAELPWIAFLNEKITNTPQQGYYIAYLFSGDGKKIFLTIALGVTNRKGLKQLQKDKSILINNLEKLLISKDIKRCNDKVNLMAKKATAKKYESSVVCYKKYNTSKLPDENKLKEDLSKFVKIYNDMYEKITNVCAVINSIKGKGEKNNIIHNNTDNIFLSAKEYKKRINHFIYEGRLSSNDIEKIKKQLGYTCEACGFNFKSIYPKIGNKYIEAHHKIPYSQIKENDSRETTISDFAVLCSNCHKMIHKLNDPADIDGLKNIIKLPKNKTS